MNRVYNFSAGPSVLPVEVLQRAQKEMLSYSSSGMSVMEMSHRSPVYQEIFDTAKSSLIQLMSIPSDYEVLFLQGGASLQFASIPLNISNNKKCLYVDSGIFAHKSIVEAQRYADVEIIASSKDNGYKNIPTQYDIDQSASYLHITSNNTIFGTSYSQLPNTGDVPLVGDLSSEICGVDRDVSKFGLIYAGAQKNLGPAGLTVVIVRKSLLDRELSITPSILSYSKMAKSNSMQNTPSTYSIYIAMLNLEYMLANGGVAGAQERNLAKSSLLYDFIDNSKIYTPVADRDSRSIMNVTFTLPSDDLTQRFVKEAAQNSLINLKGHRAAGGIRASIYNAMTYEGVSALVDFMGKFEQSN